MKEGMNAYRPTDEDKNFIATLMMGSMRAIDKYTKEDGEKRVKILVAFLIEGKFILKDMGIDLDKTISIIKKE